ncbi:hypothetical protein Lalb_Chr06g0168401 [Lupinus albus]|uniref:Uncharacterized protein n=1 Tax=Lupinus albus TaxID=3870 RepID=A0A6A4QFL1_LUPAL|nr:hypothetical protein Lalb_Chr06g0168401 [Lupinus albus]
MNGTCNTFVASSSARNNNHECSSLCFAGTKTPLLHPPFPPSPLPPEIEKRIKRMLLSSIANTKRNELAPTRAPLHGRTAIGASRCCFHR